MKIIKNNLPSFVTGFGAGVLQIVPVAKSLACCVIVPVAAFFALRLDQKANNNYTSPIKISKAVTIGLLTGIYAAIFGSVFDIIITFITRNNDIVAVYPEFQKFLGEFPITDALKQEVLDIYLSIINQIKETGFSFFYSISILFNNLIINSIFGLIGGLIGVQIINSKISKSDL